MAQDPGSIAATYFDSWRTGNFEALRPFVADDVSFVGPLGTVDNAEDFVKGLQQIAKMTTKIVVHKRFADGPDVITWFDLYTADAGPLPTANWTHVEDGKITRVRVAFDPRPIAPPGR